ncbi:sensor histidine kinase [Silvanigrella aquatica]|uniref:histidine kinase n=1 Tax=Silvanigrella aquatica TaxID=1915309 RepID=A0A1L4CYV7_9BACT|nr:response regulator [Silvanigrella aquatica]APJ03139.1 hypothetical protein AXG55_04150 [Silvanigrella aquatica]
MNKIQNNLKPKILIVEDEAILAKALEETLNIIGYEVTGIADNGMKAILLAISSDADLVLMDIRLKGKMDGVEAAEKIREQKKVPIVFLTANQDSATFERAKIEGAYGYILKPFQERELQIVIDIALNQFKERKNNSDMEHALLNSEKLAIVGTLSSGIIHDINSPLTNIFLNIEMLNKKILNDSDIVIPPQVENVIKNIEKNAHSISTTVKNYRSMIESTDAEVSTEFNIKLLCKEVLEVCGYLALEKKVKFKELSSVSDTKVCFGRTSLFQVMVNLIRNACDAVENTKDAWVQILWEDSSPNFIILKVIDSGVGIPADIHTKIFETLFTTKSPGKGTGLGLSLCKRILDKFKGSIELDINYPNTCFILKIPKNN